MRRFIFLGALCALAALPSDSFTVGPRGGGGGKGGGGGGGRPAARPAPRPSPAMNRPAPKPAARPAPRPQASRPSMGPSRPAQRPAAARPAPRPSPGIQNRPAGGRAPTVTRPAGQPAMNRPAMNRPSPAIASPGAIRPSPGVRPGGGGLGPSAGVSRPTTPIVNRPAPGIATRPGAGGGGQQLRPSQPINFPNRPGAGGGGVQRPELRPAVPGGGGGGIQRPELRPGRPGQDGGGVQRPELRPSRPGQDGGSIPRPGQLPSRPGQDGGGIQRPDLRPSRPGQGGGGEQWRPDRPLDPDRPLRPETRPTRPGQGGSGEQWRPDRPIRPDRPDRPIINNPGANIGNRVIAGDVNSINVNQWNQYNQSTLVAGGGGYNRPWYGGAGYWNQPFYGGMSAGYWSRPWNNYHYGWLSGYWNQFSALPAFWTGAATASAFDPAPTFAYSNPYYAAPPPAPESTTIVIQAPDYSQPIPAPSVEQTVIAYPPAPDREAVQAGEPLPTTAPPAPPKDDTATAANKLFDEAREAFKDGKYADAQAKAEQAIAKLPSDAALHEFRSLALFAQVKYKDAASGLYAVLAAGPGWNWETVSALYGDPADYTKQLRALEQFVADKPDAGEGHFLLAYHSLVLGRKDEAVNQFKEVVRVQPNDKLSAELLKALTTPAKNGAAG